MAKMVKTADEFRHANCGGRILISRVFIRGRIQTRARCEKCEELHRFVGGFNIEGRRIV
jgi:hypothetical protein